MAQPANMAQPSHSTTITIHHESIGHSPNGNFSFSGGLIFKLTHAHSDIDTTSRWIRRCKQDAGISKAEFTRELEADITKLSSCIENLEILAKTLEGPPRERVLAELGADRVLLNILIKARIVPDKNSSCCTIQ